MKYYKLLNLIMQKVVYIQKSIQDSNGLNHENLDNVNVTVTLSKQKPCNGIGYYVYDIIDDEKHLYIKIKFDSSTGIFNSFTFSNDGTLEYKNERFDEQNEEQYEHENQNKFDDSESDSDRDFWKWYTYNHE